MNTTFTEHATQKTTTLSTLLLVILALALVGCSDQATNTGTARSEADQLALTDPVETEDGTIEGTMQVSPFKINLQSKGASESILAIKGLVIPAAYRLADFDFMLSFNGDEVTKAYDCYYCYIDNNLIISFDKSDVIASPVTVALANTEAVATVNGYFRVESDDDGYDTQLSTEAMVEIISPSRAVPDPEAGAADAGI